MVADKDVVFRVRGVPDEFLESDVQDVLRTEFGSDQPGEIRIATLAPYYSRRKEKVGTVSFSKIPPVLLEHSDYHVETLRSSRGVSATQPLVLDKHFEGFTPIHHGKTDFEIDIIALSGLNGHAFGSFKCKDSSYMWLRDDIPDDLPKARVFLWGYNTRGDTFQNINDLGKRLSGDLRILRRDLESPRRVPIVFIAHSLGGLVVHSAIRTMSDGVDDMDKKNFRSLRGALFFGVPRQGMNIQSLVPMFHERAQQSLLHPLDHTNSSTLQIIAELYDRKMSSRGDFQCLNFYETMASPTAIKKNGIWTMSGEPAVLVTPASATGGKVYDVEGHEAIQVNRTHSDLVKFASRYDGAYERVLDFLHRLSKKESRNVWELSEDEKDFLKSLSFMEQDWREQDDSIKAAPGTCGWLFEQNSFHSWLKSPTSSLLWILGHPGAGKSTLMNSAVRWKRNTVENSEEIVAAFYVHGRGSELQHSPSGLYRSMLHQLLPYDLERLESLTEEWLKEKGTRETWTWSERMLRKDFNSVVTSICKELPVTLFVDALDELGKGHAVRFIEEFGSMIKALREPGGGLKICFSCRHYPNLYPDFNSYVYPGLPSESSFCVRVEEKNGTDIQTLITSHRASRKMDAKMRDEVFQLLRDRASGVFQWVVLVMDQVDRLLDYGSTPSAIKQEIQTIPTGLEDLYHSLLISSNPDPGQTLKLFQWLLFTVRPLSVAELRDALAIEACMGHKSYSDIQCSRNYYVLEKMDQSVRSISKGLVQVKVHMDTAKPNQHVFNSFQEKTPDYQVNYQSVEFIHESVRDYLIEKGLDSLKRKLDLLPRTPRHSCQFQLSRSCIGYLNLNEINRTVCSYRSDNYRYVDKTPTCDYALRDYAHFFWIHHVMKTEQDHIDQQDLLAIFGFGNGTDDLPSIYVVDYPYTVSAIFAQCRKEDLYLYQMSQKDDQLLSTMEHWDTFRFRDVWIQFHQVWMNRGGHLSISSILCLAGIYSALRQIRILQPDLYRSSERGRLLMYALLGRHEQIIQDYLEDLTTEDANLSTSPGLDFHIDGWSPLGFAVETDQEDLLQTLLDAGADPNLYFRRTLGSWGTCLFAAMQRDSSNMVRSLLHAGADANLLSEADEDSRLVPLHRSVESGDVDVVRALLESGASPNIPDNEDRTPLSILVDNSYLIPQDKSEKIIKLLVDHGADPNYRSDQRKTTILTSLVASLDYGLPLRYWGISDYDGLLEFLLNSGAHPGILDGFNTSALERNLFHRLGEIDIDGRLLGWKDEYGYTTLMCELMIRKSFGWRQVERFGEMLEILRSLANDGEYDFNVQAHDGNNLLSVAVIMDSAKIVGILLKHQTVDPNLQDINGHTPLMKAADYGHKDIVKHFLDCERTAVGMADRCGWTAFDWAVHAGNAVIATWLRNAMV